MTITSDVISSLNELEIVQTSNYSLALAVHTATCMQLLDELYSYTAGHVTSV